MPSDHSRTHHSAQCGRVAAGIAGDSPSLFHSVPVGMGHGGVWSNFWFPVCKCKCFCLKMQKFWFRHICIVRMSWVVGLSPTVGFLPEGTCTFCSGACRTCTLGSGRSLRNMPRLFLPAYISVSFSSDLHPFSLSAEKVSFALRRRTTPSVVDFAYWKLPPSLLVIALVNSPYGQYSCTLSEEVPCSINNCAFYLLLLVRIWMPCNNDLVKVQTPYQIWITHTAVLQCKLQTKCLHDLLEGGDFFAGKPQPTST